MSSVAYHGDDAGSKLPPGSNYYAVCLCLILVLYWPAEWNRRLIIRHAKLLSVNIGSGKPEVPVIGV